MMKRPSMRRLPAAPVADERLLSLLKRLGRLDAKAASSAERAMATEPVGAIEAIVATGALNEQDIARIVATELRLPLVDLRSSPPDEQAVAAVSRSVAEHYGLVPARVRQGSLIVAMANPFDKEALGAIEAASPLKLQPVVAPASQVLEAIERVYSNEASLDTLLADVPGAASVDVVAEQASTLGANLDHEDVQAITREAEQPPIVKMVNLLLFEAFKVHASDIHIEPGPNVVLVRFRIDGILEDHLQIPKWVQGPIVARIKVMAQLDITERRLPQDGHLAVRVRDSLLDVRVSSMPTTFGEKIVMRLLDPAAGNRKLADGGLSARDLAIVRSVIERPEGMILVTGPTGSGKTTTLYAIIQEILSPELNIVTIENPVEYELKGVTQIPINEKQGLTFAEVLRSVLRQDPDVILVGEIRDRETAEIAFQAAQTGHLVLSTVHTNDAIATVTRLLELGVEPRLIGPSLLAVVAQRLVRKICPSCAEPVATDEQTRRVLGLQAGDGLRRGKGCPACRNSGFRGRTGCYEVLKVTRAVQQLIEQRAPETAIRAVAEDEGFTTLLEDARAKIAGGVTTPEEVLRVIEVEHRGPTCPACLRGVESNYTVCPYCKNALRRVCPGCGAEMKKKWTACPFCGTEAAGTPAEAKLLPETAAPAPELRSFEVPTVLVVDDDADIRTLLELTLARAQFPIRVETAANGEEALAKVAALHPHLVILDLMMPGIDGYEVCKRLRADLSTALIPVLMLTALDDPGSKRQGFLAGTDDYVVKPFEWGELLARVRRLLERTYRWSPPGGADEARRQAASADS